MNSAVGNSAGSSPQPPHDIHCATEDRLSDLSVRAPDGGGWTRVCLLAGAVGTALAMARWLGTTIGFPGTQLHPEIVGWLADHAYDKAPETGLFFYTLLLAPLLAVALTALAARIGGDGDHAWLALGGIAAAAAGCATALGALGGERAASICLGVWVTTSLLSRLRLRRQRPRATLGRRIAALEAELGSCVAATVALAIAVLSAGPRIAVPNPLAGQALLAIAGRAGGILAGSLAVVVGVALLIDRLRGDRQPGVWPGAVARRALRHAIWLMAIRLAPDTVGWVATMVVLSVLGVTVSALRRPPAQLSDPPATGDRRFFRYVFLPALVIALVFHRDVNGSIDFYHEGEWLSPAAEMLRGRLPFSEIYLQHGFIQNALRSFLTFKLFAPTLAWDRLSTNFCFALTHAAVLLMGLQLFRSPLTAWLFAVGLATPGLYLQPRLLGLFLALAGVLLDLRWSRAADGSPIPRRHAWPLVGAGAAVSLGAFWSLDTGIYAGGAIGVFLLLEGLGRNERSGRRLLPLLWLAVGVGLGAAPFLLWLAAHGMLADFVTNSLRQAAYQLSVWGLPYPPVQEWIGQLAADPRGTLADGRFIGFAAATTFVGCVVTLAMRSRRGRVGRFGLQVLLLTLTGAMVFRTALGRSDPSHVSFVKALWWPLGLRMAEYLAVEPAARLRSALRWVPLTVVVGYFVTAYAPVYGLARQWIRLSEPLCTTPGGGAASCPLPRLAGVLIPEPQARALASLAACVDEELSPAETFFDFSNMGALYFLLDRPAPSRYLYAVYAATHAMQREMIADLEKTRPGLMLTSDVLGIEAIDGVPNERRHPLLAEYLDAHYCDELEAGFGTVHRRRDR